MRRFDSGPRLQRGRCSLAPREGRELPAGIPADTRVPDPGGRPGRAWGSWRLSLRLRAALGVRRIFFRDYRCSACSGIESRPAVLMTRQPSQISPPHGAGAQRAVPSQVNQSAHASRGRSRATRTSPGTQQRIRAGRWRTATPWTAEPANARLGSRWATQRRTSVAGGERCGAPVPRDRASGFARPRPAPAVYDRRWVSLPRRSLFDGIGAVEAIRPRIAMVARGRTRSGQGRALRLLRAKSPPLGPVPQSAALPDRRQTRRHL
jgi:hypothetical protein